MAVSNLTAKQELHPMSRTKSFEEAADSLLAGSANEAWKAVNRNKLHHLAG
jgi:hypothetical protein